MQAAAEGTSICQASRPWVGGRLRPGQGPVVPPPRGPGPGRRTRFSSKPSSRPDEGDGLGALEPVGRAQDQEGVGSHLQGAGQGQRKVASHPVDARHQDAGPAGLAGDPGREYEAPEWAGQVMVEPTLGQLGLAGGHGLPEPQVPGLDKLSRQSAGDEIAEPRQLAVETGGAWIGTGSTGSWGGLTGAPGSGSRAARRVGRGCARWPRAGRSLPTSRTEKRTLNSSSWLVACILARSSIRNQAQAPSSVTLDSLPSTPTNTRRTRPMPSGEGHCRVWALRGPCR